MVKNDIYKKYVPSLFLKWLRSRMNTFLLGTCYSLFFSLRRNCDSYISFLKLNCYSYIVAKNVFFTFSSILMLSVIFEKIFLNTEPSRSPVTSGYALKGNFRPLS